MNTHREAPGDSQAPQPQAHSARHKWGREAGWQLHTAAGDADPSSSRRTCEPEGLLTLPARLDARRRGAQDEAVPRSQKIELLLRGAGSTLRLFPEPAPLLQRPLETAGHAPYTTPALAWRQVHERFAAAYATLRKDALEREDTPN